MKHKSLLYHDLDIGGATYSPAQKILYIKIELFKKIVNMIIACGIFLIVKNADAQSLNMVALVIGNGNYQSVPQLSNPTNDADLIGTTLQRIGFRLITGGVVHDADLQNFNAELNSFASEAQAADVAIIYYAGHGLQVNGTNFLVPIDANPNNVGDVAVQMINADKVLDILDKAKIRLKFLILDACRNNPFATRDLSLSGSGLANMSRGLAALNVPEGTMIWYATQPGNVAQDGTGNNGPFATAISRNIGIPGRDVYAVFNATGTDVVKVTKERQHPWIAASSIKGDFYFINKSTGRSIFTDVDSDQPTKDRIADIFLNNASSSNRAFSFGENYVDVNKSLDAPFALPKYSGLPQAKEYPDADIRYLAVPVSNLPSFASALLPDGVGTHCIAPGSFFIFFFKDEKLFHVSIRFAKNNACAPYDWAWNPLFPDNSRSRKIDIGNDQISILSHELPTYSVLEITKIGVANESASIFQE
ncbi:hypothetical protein ASG35_11870 [Burkholderia sp. Leaf177]|uniref:caspase family protein n=1 Tax=Burkholderia sp. Leaf177 TaxID=1736287 RepID=UPI0006FAE3DB|nr:caspase family protein [Burkholderia sp. Leaf177]KQR76974.1 hypothetical protein ASG35_11870 [Burkholderia sp. Leaf177]